MRTNITKQERTLRFFSAMVLLVAFIINVVPFGLGVTLLAVSGPLFLTSLVGFCPIAEMRRVKIVEEKE